MVVGLCECVSEYLCLCETVFERVLVCMCVCLFVEEFVSVCI